MMQSDAQPVRTRRPRGQSEARRVAVLAAAKRLFLSEGFAQATMRRIASEVGVSATALYSYFPDKDAIVQTLADEFFAELLHRLEASQSSDSSPADKLRAGLRTYIDFALSRPDEYRLTFMATGRLTSVAEACAAVDDADRSFAVLERGVRAMMDAGAFGAGDPVAVAESIWAALHGVSSLLLDHAGHLVTPPAQLADMVVEMAVRGFGPTEG